MSQSDLKIAMQLYGCDPDELNHVYSKLTDDEKSQYDTYASDSDYQQYLLNLELPELYKEVIYWLEHGEDVPNHEQYILKLLKEMTLPKPIYSIRDPELNRAILETMKRVTLPLIFKPFTKSTILPDKLLSVIDPKSIVDKEKTESKLIKDWLKSYTSKLPTLTAHATLFKG